MLILVATPPRPRAANGGHRLNTLVDVPRGVAIPDVRQQLFAAVEQVIIRDGPGKLSGRAVTGEAGVATGLLYSHFRDLDDFLVAYAVDRAFLISANAKALPDQAGTGTVAENLVGTLLATPFGSAQALTRLLAARPELAAGVRSVLGDGNTGIDAIEAATAAYLAAERELGRVAAGADTEALARALAGTLHHLVLTAEEPEIPALVTRTVTALADGVAKPSTS